MIVPDPTLKWDSAVCRLKRLLLCAGTDFKYSKRNRIVLLYCMNINGQRV